MTYIGGFTNTADGLRRAQDIFNRSNRTGVNRILLLITDGKPTLNAPQEIDVARNIRNNGIRIAALGVTNSIDDNTLIDITGDPSLVIRSENFTQLTSIVGNLLNAACRVPPRPTFRPPPPTPRPTFAPPPGVVCNADIVFAVDASGSIETQGAGNWDLVLNFLSTMATQIVGPNPGSGTRIGMSRFSDTGDIISQLYEFSDLNTFLGVISKMEYKGGFTNTADGLRRAQDIFNQSNRPGVNRILILITDGKPTLNGPEEIDVARNIRSNGIRIAALGVTNSIDDNTLINITGDPSLVIRSENFNQLRSVVGNLLNAACRVTPRPTFRPPPPTPRPTFAPPPTVVCDADVVFAVDASGSIETSGIGNWELQTQFLERMATRISQRSNSPQSGTRIGMTRFSDEGVIINDFAEYTDLNTFIGIIRAMKYKGGFTNTADGLRRAQDIFARSRRGGVARILIVITDGKPTAKVGQETGVADAIRRNGIRIVALGVTNSIDEPFLVTLTGDPNLVVRAADFGRLEGIVDDLLDIACRNEPFPTPRPTFAPFPTPRPTFAPFPTPRPPVPPGCVRSDIVFVVDSSSNINFNNWNVALQFFQNLALSLSGQSRDLRIGAVSFSDNARLISTFNQYRNINNFVTLIQSIPYIGRGSNIGDGLSRSDEVFRMDARQSTSRTVILLVGGNANVNVNGELQAANNLKNQGIRIISIGVGQTVNSNTLLRIAGRPIGVFTTNDFRALNNLVNPIISLVCEVPVPTPFPTPRPFTPFPTFRPTPRPFTPFPTFRPTPFPTFRPTPFPTPFPPFTPFPTFTPRPAPLQACRDRADVVFVVDSSAQLLDVDTTWPLLRETIAAIIEYLPTFGPNNYQFGLVQFSVSPKLVFTLGEGNKLFLQNQVRSLQFLGRDSNLAGAFDYTRRAAFGGFNDRSNAPNIVVLFSDGIPTVRRTDTITSANELKQVARIVPVGISGRDGRDDVLLNRIGSGDEAITVRSVEELARDLNRVLQSICPFLPFNPFPITVRPDSGERSTPPVNRFTPPPNRFTPPPNRFTPPPNRFTPAPFTQPPNRFTPAPFTPPPNRFTPFPFTRPTARFPNGNTQNIFTPFPGFTQVFNGPPTVFIPRNTPGSFVTERVPNFGPLLLVAESESLCEKPLDLAFVIDSSGTVRDQHWTSVMTFFSLLSQRFKIGTENTQIATVIFSNFAQALWRLNTHTNANDLNNALKEVPHINYTTNLAQALEFTRTKVFTNSTSEGDRSAAPNTAIVFLDGPENELMSATSHQAELLKDSTEVLLIAMGDVKNSTLYEVATSHEHIIKVDTMEDLMTILSDVTKKICKTV